MSKSMELAGPDPGDFGPVGRNPERDTRKLGGTSRDPSSRFARV